MNRAGGSSYKNTRERRWLAERDRIAQLEARARSEWGLTDQDSEELDYLIKRLEGQSKGRERT